MQSHQIFEANQTTAQSSWYWHESNKDPVVKQEEMHHWVAYINSVVTKAAGSMTGLKTSKLLPNENKNIKHYIHISIFQKEKSLNLTPNSWGKINCSKLKSLFSGSANLLGALWNFYPELGLLGFSIFFFKWCFWYGRNKKKPIATHFQGKVRDRTNYILFWDLWFSLGL